MSRERKWQCKCVRIYKERTERCTTEEITKDPVYRNVI